MLKNSEILLLKKDKYSLNFFNTSSQTDEEKNPQNLTVYIEKTEYSGVYYQELSIQIDNAKEEESFKTYLDNLWYCSNYQFWFNIFLFNILLNCKFDYTFYQLSLKDEHNNKHSDSNKQENAIYVLSEVNLYNLY